MPSSRHNHPANKFDNFLVGALLIVGLYMPSSFGSDNLFAGPTYLVCVVVFCCLILRRGRLPSFPVAASLVSVIPLLILFTFITGFDNPTLGELAQFITLALLYMSTLKPLRFGKSLSVLYLTVNMVNIGLGLAILAGSERVGQVLIGYYSQGYEGLVPSMLLLRKPVLTFGTHSVAAFFLFLFFYLNWKTYKIKENKVFLILALSDLVLTFSLLSVTGVLLGCAAVVQIFVDAWSSIRPKWFWVPAMSVMGLILLGFQGDHIANYWSQITETGQIILTTPGHGLFGRIAPTGTMDWDIQFIKSHPFSPVGLSVNTTLLVADMGLLDYFIRGSVFLVAWVYGGLFFFLKRNLISRADLYMLFFVVVAFESGFSVLPYFRTPLLLAFIVIYLNELNRFQHIKKLMTSLPSSNWHVAQ